MALLLTMFPFYVLGNFHCLGMCGPLAMTLGHHQYRFFYFLGRLVSYSLAGFIAGGLGAVLQAVLHPFHLSAIVSLVFGAIICLFGASMIMGKPLPGSNKINKMFSRVNEPFVKLMLQDRRWPTFWFGFFTVLLPCGQTVIVFSACALAGSPLVGILNGFCFALLTSPSLYLSMQTQKLLKSWNLKSQTVIGYFGLLAGVLGCCRGLADLQVIPHLNIPNTHIAFF